MTSQAGSVAEWHNPACMDERNGVYGQLSSGGVRHSGFAVANLPARYARGDATDFGEFSRVTLAEVKPRR